MTEVTIRQRGTLGTQGPGELIPLVSRSIPFSVKEAASLMESRKEPVPVTSRKTEFSAQDGIVRVPG
jgi:hypothetical protein